MGGCIGIASSRDILEDIFFTTDYHSHLSTYRGGVAFYDKTIGLQREIHDIENVPFRARFEHIFDDMRGTSGIGCISDFDPQPLLIRSRFGTFAICFTGKINNGDELVESYLEQPGSHFDAMTAGGVNMCELLASLITQKGDFVDGIRFVQDKIEGTASILILKENGHILAARDKYGRLPIHIAKDEAGYCAAFEDFSYKKLGYESVYELGPGEIVEITPDRMTQLVPPKKEMKICAFLWTYYGFPTSNYEGINVEIMRYRNGRIMARNEINQGTLPDSVDSVSGVPDSGVAHALGYAAETHLPMTRPMVKYTPTWMRSFTKDCQSKRIETAKMKQIPVIDLIRGKNLLFVDDSIVRGTQIKATASFLRKYGAKSLHIRSACPPIMFSCKYLNFARATPDKRLRARRTIYALEGEEGDQHLEEYADAKTKRGKKLREDIAKESGLTSLDFQSLEGLVKAIGLPKCQLCTYCWEGKE